MADTTPSKIRNIAKHLRKVDDSVLEMYIDDSKLEIEKYKSIPERYHEKLQRYLAAHFATLDYRRPESRNVEGLQVSYKASGEDATSDSLSGTEYGKEFHRTLEQALGNKSVRFGVL